MLIINRISDAARCVLERRKMRRTSPLPVKLQDEIIVAYRQLGRPLKSNPIDILGYKVSYMGEYEIRWLFRELFLEACYFFQPETDSPIIFDCGSNIGMSLLFFKKLYPNARISAFEPDPYTFVILERNV